VRSIIKPRYYHLHSFFRREGFEHIIVFHRKNAQPLLRSGLLVFMRNHWLFLLSIVQTNQHDVIVFFEVLTHFVALPHFGVKFNCILVETTIWQPNYYFVLFILCDLFCLLEQLHGVLKKIKLIFQETRKWIFQLNKQIQPQTMPKNPRLIDPII
jgi:hypothetical protein